MESIPQEQKEKKVKLNFVIPTALPNENLTHTHRYGINMALPLRNKAAPNTLLSGGRDSYIRQFTTSKTAAKGTGIISGHNGWVNDLVEITGSECPMFASCSSDCSVKVWKARGFTSRSIQEGVVSDQNQGTLPEEKFHNNNRNNKIEDPQSPHKAQPILTPTTPVSSSSSPISWNLCQEWLSHSDHVKCLAYSSESQKIVSAAIASASLFLWELERGTPCMKLSVQRNKSDLPASQKKYSAYALAYGPEPNLVVAGFQDKMIRLWDPRASSRPIHKLRAHLDTVRSFLFSTDGRKLLSASSDGTVRFWDLSQQRVIDTYYHHSQSVWTLAWAQQNKTFFSGGLGCDIFLTDLDTESSAKLASSGTPIFRLISEDPENVWVCTAQPDLVKYTLIPKNSPEESEPNYGILQESIRILGRRSGAVRASVLKNKRHILTENVDSSLSLYDVFTGDCVNHFPAANFEKKVKELSEKVSIPSWFTVDTSIIPGDLTVQFESPQCFKATTYLSSCSLSDEKKSEDVKLNFGTILLKSIFSPTLLEPPPLFQDFQESQLKEDNSQGEMPVHAPLSPRDQNNNNSNKNTNLKNNNLNNNNVHNNSKNSNNSNNSTNKNNNTSSNNNGSSKNNPQSSTAANNQNQKKTSQSQDQSEPPKNNSKATTPEESQPKEKLVPVVTPFRFALNKNSSFFLSAGRIEKSLTPRFTAEILQCIKPLDPLFSQTRTGDQKQCSQKSDTQQMEASATERLNDSESTKNEDSGSSEKSIFDEKVYEEFPFDTCMPTWLFQALYHNQVPDPQTTISFNLLPFTKSLKELPGLGQQKLTASRLLRLAKVVQFVVEKLGMEKNLQTQKVVLLCNGKEIPESSLLCEVVEFYWQQSKSLVIHFNVIPV